SRPRPRTTPATPDRAAPCEREVHRVPTSTGGCAEGRDTAEPRSASPRRTPTNAPVALANTSAVLATRPVGTRYCNVSIPTDRTTQPSQTTTVPRRANATTARAPTGTNSATLSITGPQAIWSQPHAPATGSSTRTASTAPGAANGRSVRPR